MKLLPRYFVSMQSYKLYFIALLSCFLIAGCTSLSHKTDNKNPKDNTKTTTSQTVNDSIQKEQTVIQKEKPATSLDLTVGGEKLEDNRIFGHNRARILGGGLPEGGVYSGPGVKDGKFTPAQAGNGIWTITYSKPGYVSSSAKIEVFGSPDNITDKVCEKCKGKHTEICPDCSGVQMINDLPCPRCEGRGTIPCRQCMGDKEVAYNDFIKNYIPILSCSRITYETSSKKILKYIPRLINRGHWDLFVLKLIPMNMESFTTSGDFEPSLYLYIRESATNKIKRYVLPTLQTEQIKGERIKSDTHVSYVFEFDQDQLIESNICLMEIEASYGQYKVSIFFDLEDIIKEETLVEGDLNVKAILFRNRFYTLPDTMFTKDINENWEKISSDKGWKTEEIYSGWLLQSNDKGNKRILDNNRMLRMEKDDNDSSKRIDSYWTDIKRQLDDKYDFWGKWFKSNPPRTFDSSTNLSQFFPIRNADPQTDSK